MTARGPKADLARFRGAITTQKTQLESGHMVSGTCAIFDNIIPMPKELENISSPLNSNDKAQVKLAKRLKKKYGFSDWYEWQYANWGVKWGDCDTTVKWIRNTYLKLSFRTPWGPPEPGLLRISAIYPTITLTLWYYERGQAYKGKTVMKGGKVTERTTGEYHGPRGG